MPANNADFHGYTFNHTGIGEGFNTTVIQAHHPDHGNVGHMILEPLGEDNQRRVRNIMVNEAHRRKGIATGMWNFANQLGLNPKHSDNRTDEGEAWANSVGGNTPKRLEW